ncbi:transcriptional regulator, MarR family with acetyltransferase activity [Singulisphaera sp. GP187]|uniref:bifunctional helix-turn-helix transcriptional regulator/GNAT family N-acetyltransferase n=1 Tax=Singulisphaera sp. GP187 TaxID=1882752 RepID=UPI000928C1BB|nr:bifunctional helix-turn-helix transcriptional regulator/GNAT family N-acetyltransferase [Singulisphaera sp. GP187]SIO28177.1 transcriptional regulator, MarR family with acetyltransferase activity [Singulisphaera sp. GP187]
MTGNDLGDRIGAMRHFNRFYTQRIGVLRKGLLDSPFSLAEARVIYELARRTTTTAAELCRDLEMDPGHLSRMLGGLQRRGLVDKRPSETDRRRTLLGLTDRGRGAFAVLDTAAREEIEAMVGGLSPDGQGRLVQAMRTIEGLLNPRSITGRSYVLRPPRPGDMGWVVSRHGSFYAEECGWGERFEAMVAGIVAEFARGHDPERERCWMAELDGEVAGSVFLVRQSAKTAQLRLLLVEPEARGLGIGARLVDECIRFAQSAGYQKVTLWTINAQHAARHLYQRAGFRLVREEPHRTFGGDFVDETWELKL